MPHHPRICTKIRIHVKGQIVPPLKDRFAQSVALETPFDFCKRPIKVASILGKKRLHPVLN
jgi:Mg-chelatase subunit ChlI